jgi:hypothetical protein
MNLHNLASHDPTDLARPRDLIWPVAIVGFGLSLTVGWTLFLGYGLFTLIGHAL